MARTGIIADLFMGPGNLYWDLGRILALLAVIAFAVAIAWNIHMGQAIGFADLGGGLAAVLASLAAWMTAKTYQRSAALRDSAGGSE